MHTSTSQSEFSRRRTSVPWRGLAAGIFRLSLAGAVIAMGIGLTTWSSSASAAPAIVRHAASPPGLILQGVTVPAGAKMLYLSGQLASPIGAPPPTGTSATIAQYGDTRTQTISVFEKIKGLLAAQGFRMADIIKLTVFVAGDPKLGGKMDFAGMNDAFKLYFGTPENPTTVARSTVQVAALAAPQYLVEIEATAAK